MLIMEFVFRFSGLVSVIWIMITFESTQNQSILPFLTSIERVFVFYANSIGFDLLKFYHFWKRSENFSNFQSLKNEKHSQNDNQQSNRYERTEIQEISVRYYAVSLWKILRREFNFK